jgi:two-component system OmpR family sensor kinase
MIRFFLTFAIPASGVLIYRYLARRALREFQAKADIMVQSERAIGRAKDEFIAGLSHELRTPLTSIYGFAEVMSEDSDVPADSRELAGIVANEASELTRMVDDLLAAARLDSTGLEVELVPTSVRSVVDSALAPFARAGLEVPVRGEDVMVKTDPARLRQVIVNLVSNAVKHGGPQVGIEISEGAEAGVDIEVWDNGSGVTEDRVGSMFKRFAHDGSTPLMTGSLGLGLAVAGRLTSLVGGKLDYQRFSGKTYFIVTLPTAETTTKPASLPGRPGEEVQPQQESVADVIRALSA